MPANSGPIFKGIKIYFSVELKENESYKRISEAVIDGVRNKHGLHVVDENTCAQH